MKRKMWPLLLAFVGISVIPQTVLAGQFKKPVYYSSSGLPWVVVKADFNHDGNLDLAVADFGNQVVQTLLGTGDGSFRRGPSFPIASPYSPIGLAVQDFDHDGNPDLAVVEANGPGIGKLGIFLGNGDGTFHQSAEYQLSDPHDCSPFSQYVSGRTHKVRPSPLLDTHETSCRNGVPSRVVISKRRTSLGKRAKAYA